MATTKTHVIPVEPPNGRWPWGCRPQAPRRRGSRPFEQARRTKPKDAESEHQVVGVHAVEADPVGEQREREHACQPVRPLHPRRQVARRGDDAVIEHRLQCEHVFQREFAGEQLSRDRELAVAQAPAEKRVDAEQAVQIHGVLGERRTAAERCAAEHALRRGKTVLGRLSGIEEEPKDLYEIGAADRHVDGDDAQADALHAFDVHRAGDQFGECRQPFLRRGGARRAADHGFQQWLLTAVDAGERVHERFVDQQLVAVVFAETGIGAQADAGGTGGGLGDQRRVQLDLDLVPGEERIDVALQLVAHGFGGHHRVGLDVAQLLIHVVGHFDEMPRGVEVGRAVARQPRHRVAVQPARIGGDLVTAGVVE